MKLQKKLNHFIKYSPYLILIFFSIFSFLSLSIDLLDHHSFRQTQTNLITKNIDIFSIESLINTKLPIFSEPWIFIQEFPIYQLSVKIIFLLLNDYDLSSRLTSLLYFLASIYLVYKLYSPTKFNTIILFVSSPILIFFSSAALIESTATFFCILYVYVLTKNNNIFFPVITLVIVGITKLTLLPILIYYVCFIDKTFKKRNFIDLFISGFLILIWKNNADFYSLQSYITEILASHNLRGWIVGGFDDRFNYDILFKYVGRSIIYTGPGLLLFYFIRNKNYLINYFILILIPFICFPKINYIHDYYLFSTSFFIYLYTIKIIKKEEKELTHFLKLLIISINIFPFFISFGNKQSLLEIRLNENISITRETTLEISSFIRKQSNLDDIILSYNYNGWSSELAYYSDRKFTIAFNENILIKILDDDNRKEKFKYILLCNSNINNVDNYTYVKEFNNKLNYCKLFSSNLFSKARIE